jgi:hypothetical protein
MIKVGKQLIRQWAAKQDTQLSIRMRAGQKKQLQV